MPMDNRYNVHCMPFCHSAMLLLAASPFNRRPLDVLAIVDVRCSALCMHIRYDQILRSHGTQSAPQPQNHHNILHRPMLQRPTCIMCITRRSRVVAVVIRYMLDH